MEDILIPIAGIIAVFGGPVLISYWLISYRYRTRSELLSALREAAEHGQALTPETIQSIADSFRNEHADLRRGVISLAIGIAGLLCSMVVPEDLVVIARGISLFPTLIGLGYLALWFFLGRNREAARGTPLSS